jgi:rhodanese-related sulfurtransferase
VGAAPVILIHMGIEELLRESRRKLARLTPQEADRALADGALLIDIRSETQRAEDGTVPGARFIPRNVLEWRLDPSSSSRDPELVRAGALIIVMCNEGYQSSLAAATLQALGLSRATDLAGGFQAWRAAGLPVKPPQRTRPHWGALVDAREGGSLTGALFRVLGH